MIFNLGGAAFKPPVLNPNYPADVSVVQSSSASATFQVVIQEAGEPAEYTYQWYVNNSPVSGATGSTYTKTGLSTVATYIVYCKVLHPAGEVTSRSATLSVTSSLPAYTFSGTHEFINDGNNNWRLKLKSSGALRFSRLGNAVSGIDIFCVGGGGGGGSQGGGGGGGRTTTSKNRSISTNTNYTVVIGAGGGGGYAGGGANGGNGGATSISGTGLSVSAAGGDAGQYAGGGHGKGGNGGSGGGTGTQYQQVNGSSGGSDGSDGNGTNPGTGQHTTTREFGQAGATLYAGGGGGSYKSGGAGGGGSGSDFNGNASPGATNTGGGGGGSGGSSSAGAGGAGGSGIIIIRNKR